MIEEVDENADMDEYDVVMDVHNVAMNDDESGGECRVDILERVRRSLISVYDRLEVLPQYDSVIEFIEILDDQIIHVMEEIARCNIEDWTPKEVSLQNYRVKYHLDEIAEDCAMFEAAASAELAASAASAELATSAELAASAM
jgi:hypothetical protein